MENRYEAMDEVTLMETADVFKALGNVTRVKILAVSGKPGAWISPSGSA